MSDGSHWIEALDLLPHPEGGHYRETWRAPLAVEAAGFDGPRSASTAIWFLLRAGERSLLHRIRSDEVWHLYDGGPLALHVIRPDGTHEAITLGREPGLGRLPQAVVPAGAWFGALPAEGADWALVGCTVAPGFEFEDLELASRRALVTRFPQHREVVHALTIGDDE
jgi:predicted cupin superfamily sugar epimerase